MLIKEVLTLAAEELGRADFVPLIEQAYTDAAAGTAPEGEAGKADFFLGKGSGGLKFFIEDGIIKQL